jgi:hypothetical protein
MRSPCCRVSSPNVARQRLSKRVTPATNTRATIELLDPVFSMLPVSYQILCM